MKCPDCGQELAEISVTGFDKSRRCENCGGVFLEGWVVNRVAEGQMKQLPEVKANIEKFEGKTNQCPADKTPLFGYTGDDVPPEVLALKCSHCGWWWFPMTNLWKFKRAYEAKSNYLKFWRKKSDMAVFALPVLIVVVLAVTLGITVANITRQQTVGTRASAGAEEFRAAYLGDGREEVRFKVDKLPNLVLVKRLQDDVWGPVEVEVAGEGWYRVMLNDIDESSVYQMQIAGIRYYFKAK
jgi:hypothetical protein